MLPNSTESEILLDIGPGNLHFNNSPKILSSGYVLCSISLFSFSNSPCCPEFPLGPLRTQICAYQITYKPSMSYQTHPSNYLPYWKCGFPWRVPFPFGPLKWRLYILIYPKCCGPEVMLCVPHGPFWTIMIPGPVRTLQSCYNILMFWYSHLIL